MKPFTIKSKKKNNPWRFPLVAAAFLGLWFLLSHLINRELLLPSPILVGQHLFHLAGTSLFWQSILHSLGRIGAGYFAGVALALFFCFLSSQSTWANSFIQPLMSVVRATPVASFIILALVWIARQRVPTFMAMLMVVPQIYMSLMLAFSQVDRNLLEVAQVYQLSRGKVFWHLYCPSMLPDFLSACVAGLGLAWKAGVAAELLSSPSIAIGTKILESKRYLETADLFAWTIVVIVLSMVLETILRRFSAKLMERSGEGNFAL